MYINWYKINWYKTVPSPCSNKAKPYIGVLLFLLLTEIIEHWKMIQWHCWHTLILSQLNVECLQVLLNCFCCCMGEFLVSLVSLQHILFFFAVLHLLLPVIYLIVVGFISKCSLSSILVLSISLLVFCSGCKIFQIFYSAAYLWSIGECLCALKLGWI